MFFGARFTTPAHRAKPDAPGAMEIEEAAFTYDELAHLQQLRHQVLRHPACYSLDMNYRRMDFYRWLAQRGDLSEGNEGGAHR
jgi:hypothetical protein